MIVNARLGNSGAAADGQPASAARSARLVAQDRATRSTSAIGIVGK